MKLITLYSILLLILPGIKAIGQELTPPIQNYSSLEYEAASQNWDISIDDAGIVYAANNQGLLSYDGLQWELFPLKTGAIIRSVYAHEDRVYTGSYQEFGYWSRDNSGRMCYTSLMPLLGDYMVQSEEFWQILSFKEAIYFRSFRAIYKYEGDKIEPVKNAISNEMEVFNDSLIVAIDKEGVFYLEGDGNLEPLPNQQLLNGKRVVDIEDDGKNLLIGTKRELYKFNGESCSLYENKELNAQLAQSELNHILRVSEEGLVFGTIKNGIIHYNRSNGETQVYDRNNGLQNNTILGMARRDGKMWLGLDNGIDAIDLDSPIEFFTDDTGELGAVYDLVFYDEALYIASNTGVYRLDDNGTEIVEGAQGHCWNLEIIDNVLYSNHNNGTFKIVEDRFEPVETRTGSFDIVKLPSTKNKTHLIGNYTGITAYNSENDELIGFQDITFPIKKLIFENASTLWAAHPYEGVYRIGLNDDGNKSVYFKEIGEGEKNYRSDIFKINNQIAILKGEQWYKYNAFRDSLEVFEELKDYSHHKLLLEDREGFWFTNRSNNALVYTNFRDSDLIIAFRELNKRLVKNNENLVRRNDSLYYVTLNDGFARINLHELLESRKNENLGSPIIKEISDAEGSYDLSLMPSIPYKNARDITILAGLPDSDALSLNYQLIGENTIEGEVKDGILKFQNLAHGDYELNLFALSPQEIASDFTSFSFRVEPPWYLSDLMKMLYFLMFLGIVGVVYWFNRIKLNKHQWLLEQKFEKEHQERLNNLEKERLMNEITVKRKELANTTMIAAKKNEVLLDIQGELNKDRDKFSNQFRLKHIMNKINQAIKDKDEWKVFETNFNEVHEDFFKDLLENYPRLSNKDLKLCSYLKMNLTSKEIAPLMGISVRGVEVHRYRLRKKMELGSGENLTNFLIKNF